MQLACKGIFEYQTDKTTERKKDKQMKQTKQLFVASPTVKYSSFKGNSL